MLEKCWNREKYDLDYNELEDLFVLGLNHDIGYEYRNNFGHEHIGGEIEKRNKYNYWKEVYYHGNINTVYSSLYLKILNKADTQIDKYGNDVDCIKRLEDIKNRYGKNSITYKNAEILVSKLRSED